MACLSRQCPLKYFKECLPQILLGPFMNFLSQMCFGKIKLLGRKKAFQWHSVFKNLFSKAKMTFLLWTFVAFIFSWHDSFRYVQGINIGEFFSVETWIFFKKRNQQTEVWVHIKHRSSLRSCSIIKPVLRNFAKFTEKQLWQSLFFNKVAGLACNFIKKESLAQVFSCEICEISKNNVFTEHLRTTVLKTQDSQSLLNNAK